MTAAFIIFILWSLFGIIACTEYAPYCKDLKTGSRIIIGVIFLVGGPIFAVSSILELVLRILIPEGWDDDFKKY